MKNNNYRHSRGCAAKPFYLSVIGTLFLLAHKFKIIGVLLLCAVMVVHGAEVSEVRLEETKAVLSKALLDIYKGDEMKGVQSLLKSGLLSVEEGKEQTLCMYLSAMKKTLCGVYGDEIIPLSLSEAATFSEQMPNGGVKAHIFYAVAHKSGPVYWSFEVLATEADAKVRLKKLNSGDTATQALASLREEAQVK